MVVRLGAGDCQIKSPPSTGHAQLVTPFIAGRFDSDELPRGPAVYAIENLENHALYIDSSRDASRRVSVHLYGLRHKLMKRRRRC